MSLDVMKQALAALEQSIHYTQTHLQDFDAAYNRHPSTENERGVITDDIEDAFAAITALRAAIKEAQGLAEKVPARGTILEQTLGKVWDEMPHPDYQKEMEQEPVAWISEGGDVSCSKQYMDEMGFKCNPLYTAPRQWQGLTDEERHGIREWQHIQTELGPVWAPMLRYLYDAIEAKLKEKNT